MDAVWRGGGVEAGCVAVWMLVGCCLLRRFLSVCCAGECGHDAG